MGSWFGMVRSFFGNLRRQFVTRQFNDERRLIVLWWWYLQMCRIYMVMVITLGLQPKIQTEYIRLHSFTHSFVIIVIITAKAH